MCKLFMEVAGMSFSRLSFKVVAVFAFVFITMSSSLSFGQEQAIDAKWYASGGFGMIGFEGDDAVKNGGFGIVRLGYDYSDWWTFEGGIAIAPKLDENFRTDDYGNKISRLYEQSGVHDTYSIDSSLDALFHFTRWDRLDPYLTLGIGGIYYGDEIDGDQFDVAIRVGGGVMYHFNDEWAVRADARTFVAGADTEAHVTADAGVVWTWGARVAPDIVAVGGPQDSDGDRLSDSREAELGTDPYNPDTDGDKLADGDEVLVWHTDPLNPDSDWDGLKDGAEVYGHKTDPLNRDTDGGGVADGHEVIDDFTNPLDPTDDLMLISLYIPFDYDKAVIKKPYLNKLDIIAKVLSRNDVSTAVIEGHADRKANSDKEYNQKLSERRANAVKEYLVKTKGIAASRLTAKGFGFSRPKAPNDPKKGNPLNRRVEVYIRNANVSKSSKSLEVKETAVQPEKAVQQKDIPVVSPEDK